MKHKQRAIIICAGNEERWDPKISERKHLLVIEGEKILHRTVRLIKENSPETEIFVVGLDERYKVEGTELYIPTRDYENNADADKFLSSKDLWLQDGRTVVIYGDCWYSKVAINCILNQDLKEWLAFGRFTANYFTDKKYGEMFAHTFWPEHIAQHEKALHAIADLYKDGKIERCGGWEHYQVMTANIVTSRPFIGGNFFNILDFSEDFDSPEDYHNWIKRRKEEITKTSMLYQAIEQDPNIKDILYQNAIDNNMILD